MPPLFYAVAFAVSLIGAVIQAVCGFGYGPLNMSLLPYLFPYAQAVALSGLCGSTTSVFVLASSFRYIRWKTLLPCVVTAMIFAPLSVQLSVGAADGFMVHSLGAMLIALGVYSIFFSDRIRIKPTLFNGAAAGTLAVLLCAVGVGLFLGATDENFLGVAKVVFLAHVPVAFIEGAITAFMVTWLKKVSPEFLAGVDR